LSADYNNIVGNEIVFILHRSVKFSNMKSFICPVVSAIVFGTIFLGSVASEVNVSPLNEVSRVEVDETIVSLRNKRTLQGIERISFSQVTKKSAKSYSETYAPTATFDPSNTYYPSKSKKGSKTYAPTTTAYPKKSAKGSKTYAPTATAYPSKSKKGSKTYATTTTAYPKKSKKG